MDEALRSAIKELNVALKDAVEQPTDEQPKENRRGRPREFFVINADSNEVTVTGTREPNKQLGHPSRPIPVWNLESRAEVNRIIGELEEARDRVFPSDDSKLRRAMSDILWEAYCAGAPDCVLTTLKGRDEVVTRILTLIQDQK